MKKVPDSFGLMVNILQTRKVIAGERIWVYNSTPHERGSGFGSIFLFPHVRTPITDNTKAVQATVLKPEQPTVQQYFLGGRNYLDSFSSSSISS